MILTFEKRHFGSHKAQSVPQSLCEKGTGTKVPQKQNRNDKNGIKTVTHMHTRKHTLTHSIIHKLLKKDDCNADTYSVGGTHIRISFMSQIN